MSLTRRRLLAATGSVTVAGLAGCTGTGSEPTDASGGTPTGTPTSTPTDSHTPTGTQTPAATLDDARQAIEAYTDVGAALSDGYVNTREYVHSPEGSMGVHFVNPQQTTLDPRSPSVLMYDLTADGQYELMGAEWLVPADAVEETPTLFGQAFDGPMPGHGPDQPEHYDLHAWLFRDNPDGTFAAFNPDVSPPAYVEDVSAAREALAEFQDVAACQEAGYEREGGCVAGEAGGMGVHYVNHDVEGIDPERPQVLLYDERGDAPALMGAEWMVPADAVEETPTLFGQEFDGPMPGHGPDQPEHYDLHAWLFRTNPDGMFAAFNSTVDC